MKSCRLWVFPYLGVCVLLCAGLARAEVITTCNDICAISCSLIDPEEGPCIETPGAGCRLAADISCDGDDKGIRLVQERDLNLRGFDVTCTAPTCPDAIVILDEGSLIKSTTGGGDPSEADAATLSGPFIRGVNCNLNNASKVDGIAVEGPLIGALNCDIVQDSVFREPQLSVFGINIALQSTSTASNSGNDKILNNYVRDYVLPIVLQNDAQMVVDQNVFQADSATPVLSVQATTSGKFQNSVLFGDALDVVGGDASNFIFKNNVCDENSPACQDCIAEGICADYEAPF